jgi:hypothetical protein
MAVPVQWYRESADNCARRAEQSRDPCAKAAYQEMVHAWLLLADSADSWLGANRSPGAMKPDSRTRQRNDMGR